MLCKNGAVKHVVINSNAMWEDGKFVHSRTFTRDITEHRLTQMTLAYMAAIVESSEDAIIGMMLERDYPDVELRRGENLRLQGGGDEGKSITLLIPSYRPEELPQLCDKIKRGETISWYETVRLERKAKPSTWR